MRTFAQRGLPPHIARKAEMILLEAVVARRRGGGRLLRFDPNDHPRNAVGRFVQTIDQLASGDAVELADGTRIQRDADARLRVVRGGTIHRGYVTSHAAAVDALHRSARSSNHLNALGGTHAHPSYASALGGRTEAYRGVTNENVLRFYAEAEAERITSANSTDRYERRRERSARHAKIVLRRVLIDRGLAIPDLANIEDFVRASDRFPTVPTDPLDGLPAETRRITLNVQHLLRVGAQIGGTEIVETGVHRAGDDAYVWAKGHDGRVWSVRTAGDHSIAADMRPNSANVQVRSVGFDGTPYTAPALESYLSTQERYLGSAATIGGSQPLSRGVHPIMRPGAAPIAPIAATAAPVAPPPSALPYAPVVRHESYGSDPALVARVQSVVNDLHGFSADGYTAIVRRATQYEFGGDVLDRDGDPVGHFSREIRSGDQIYHSSFSMNDNQRASGFGTKFIQHQFDTYKRHGWRKVRVSTANIGRYQWAKMGFDFATNNSRDYALTAVKNAVSHLDRYGDQDRYRVVLDAVPDALRQEFLRQIDEGLIKSAPQVAAFGRRSPWEIVVPGPNQTTRKVKMWLGKWALLNGNGWDGLKQL